MAERNVKKKLKPPCFLEKCRLCHSCLSFPSSHEVWGSAWIHNLLVLLERKSFQYCRLLGHVHKWDTHLTDLLNWAVFCHRSQSQVLHSQTKHLLYGNFCFSWAQRCSWWKEKEFFSLARTSVRFSSEKRNHKMRPKHLKGFGKFFFVLWETSK